MSITGSNARIDVAHCRKEFLVEEGQGQLTIDVLPDDVLLEIFYFFRCCRGNVWHTLVHVCGRWRQIVFASTHQLKLRLFCSNRRPVKTTLDTWLTLPIVIRGYDDKWFPHATYDGFMIDALEHSDRVREIEIVVASIPFWKELAAVKKPFPALTSLDLTTFSKNAPVFPNSFFGGSAPGLRSLMLSGIPFPGLPNLLLSAHHLVRLHLLDIPDSGYISPEAMATCLSSMTSLKELSLCFRSPQSVPDRTIPHPCLLTRAVLPALTDLLFEGISKYLEDLVAQINAPLLTTLCIEFFNQQYDLDTPLLRDLISRTEAFNGLNRAKMNFLSGFVGVVLEPKATTDDGIYVELRLLNLQDGQLSESALAQLCKSCLPLLPTLEHLKTDNYSPVPSGWVYNIGSTQWMELFHPFVAVHSLYLNEERARCVASALQKLAEERVTMLFPALQNIFVKRLRPLGAVRDAITQFVAARHLLGHQVAVHDWDGGGPW